MMRISSPALHRFDRFVGSIDSMCPRSYFYSSLDLWRQVISDCDSIMDVSARGASVFILGEFLYYYDEKNRVQIERDNNAASVP